MRTRRLSGNGGSDGTFPEPILTKIQRATFEIVGIILLLFHLAGLILLELDRLLRDTMSLRTASLLRNTLL